MVEEFIEKLRADGSLNTLKWVCICVSIGLIVGGSLGAASVILFETKPDSTLATYTKCIDFDSEGARDFEEQYGGQDGVKAPDFCRKYGQGSESVAKRAWSQMIMFGLSGAGLGLIAGIIISEELAKKQK